MKYLFWSIPLGALILVGCGGTTPIEVTQARDIDKTNDFEVPVLAENDQSRFRFVPAAPTDTRPVAPGETQPLGLTWKTPDGWKELPATSMREPNLRFGPADEGECYVTRLSGGGGGLTQNINRWRKQMGAADLIDAEVEALPKKTLFGQPAAFVSIDGAFAGMGGEAKADYRLMGLILVISDAMVTVKMTGPKDLVTANEANFEAFCASLDLKSGGQ